MNLPILAFIPASASEIAWYAYGAALLIFTIHTLLIWYHWNKYAPEGNVRRRFWFLYILVAMLIVLAMTMSILTLA